MTAWLMLALSAAAATAAAQQPPVQNAVQETRAVTSIARDVASLGAGPDAVWIAWRVPMVGGERDLCSTWVTDTQFSRGTALEDQDGPQRSPVFAAPAGPLALEAGTGLVILLRATGGGVERLRAVSNDCPVDAGGRRLVWLTGVTPADSIAYLSLLAAAGPSTTNAARRTAESAITAMALHRDASAQAALIDVVVRAGDTRLRDAALQWMARGRGSDGFRYISNTLETAKEPGLRRALTNALGQTRESGTPDALLGLARADGDDQVRAEALYWYAVLAPNPAAQVIGILERDAATQVRSRGLAGLLRRPAADAVPNLITLARQSQDAGLRKEIVRSLGRSADPRAVAFMEELVKR